MARFFFFPFCSYFLSCLFWFSKYVDMQTLRFTGFAYLYRFVLFSNHFSVSHLVMVY